MREKIPARETWPVWIYEKERIASFHRVDGYIKYEFGDRELFRSFMAFLQKQGYRFQ